MRQSMHINLSETPENSCHWKLCAELAATGDDAADKVTTTCPDRGSGKEQGEEVSAADTAAACSNNSNDNHNKKQERMKLVQPGLWLRPEARRT